MKMNREIFRIIVYIIQQLFILVNFISVFVFLLYIYFLFVNFIFIMLSSLCYNLKLQFYFSIVKICDIIDRKL